MRGYGWLAGVFLLFGLAAAAPAQQSPQVQPLTPTAFNGTTPNMLQAPPPAIVQQPRSFSITSIFSGLKLPSVTSLFSRSASSTTQSIGPVLPGQHPDAFGPVRPTTKLPPPQYPDAFHPLLPTRTLPPPQYPDAFKPALPTRKLPPPQYPDAFKPLPPIRPGS